MALVPCARCRQPFYASCHDGSCGAGAPLCPWCEYADAPRDETPTPAPVARDHVGRGEGACGGPTRAPGAATGREATC